MKRYTMEELQAHIKSGEPYWDNSGRSPAKVLKLGFGGDISVQASKGHYCRPKGDDAEFYTHVEVYPTGLKDMPKSWRAALKDECIMSFVDVYEVLKVINRNGGVVEEQAPEAELETSKPWEKSLQDPYAGIDPDELERADKQFHRLIREFSEGDYVDINTATAKAFLLCKLVNEGITDLSDASYIIDKALSLCDSKPLDYSSRRKYE